MVVLRNLLRDMNLYDVNLCKPHSLSGQTASNCNNIAQQSTTIIESKEIICNSGIQIISELEVKSLCLGIRWFVWVLVSVAIDDQC